MFKPRWHTPRQIATRMFAPVDIASLAVFRIVFGLSMLWLMCFYYNHVVIDALSQPVFRSTYPGLHWVPTLPNPWLTAEIYGLRLLSAFVALGLFYRFSAPLLCLGYTHVLVIDLAFYQNHFYLLALIAFLLAFMPAHRAFSLDVLIRPRLYRATVPAWTVWALRLQLALVYFFAGVAKLNYDWLHGEPLRSIMTVATHSKFLQSELVVMALSYGGLLFDLSIAPLLLWRRTRLLAYDLCLMFHLINSQLFNVDVFPYFMIGATLIFLEPDWPKRLLARLSRKTESPQTEPAHTPPVQLKARRKLLGVALCIYFIIQIFLPLRALLHPGPVFWTGQGRICAWRMLTIRRCSIVRYFARDPITGKRWELRLYDLNTRDLPYYGRPCEVMMAYNSLRFAHHAAALLAERGRPGVEIYAEIWSSVNRRPPQLLIRPDVDLAAIELGALPAEWMTEFDRTLPSTPEEREAAREAWIALGGDPFLW